MALGAQRRAVTAMIMRGALLHALIGLGIGLGVALLAVRTVQSQLYEMKGLDAGVLTGAVLTLMAAALFAGLVPARRAASIEPARALRTE